MKEKIYKLKDLHIRLTSDCNLNCSHCYAADWFKDNKSLDTDLIKSTISQAIELGCENVTFTGGEPFLHPNIYELISYCTDKGLKVSAETNGTLLDIKKIKDINGYQNISLKISYDGNKMRGDKNAATVREKLAQLVEAELKVKVQTVISRINLDEADDIFEFTKNLGIENRVFMGHSKTGNARGIEIFEVNELIKIRESLMNKFNHVTIELPYMISHKCQKGCGWGISRCELMPNGDVTSCGPLTFARRDYIAGNITENNLKTLWNSEHFTFIRELKQEQFEGICSKCDKWHECKGSCRSISASIGGSILSSYPYCESINKNGFV